MAGKGVLFLLLGFSIVFLVKGTNYGNISNRAVDNMSDYYKATVAHNIAVSGANMAANQLFFDPTWKTGFTNKSYSGGKIDVEVRTMDAYRNIKMVSARGTYEGYSKTVEVILKPSKFSKFAYYSRVEPSNIWWISKDTVWGPFHTNGSLRVSERPVFFGKVSYRYDLIKYQYSWNDPKFYGGLESGVNLPMPADGIDQLADAAYAGGLVFLGKDTVYMKFENKTLKYKFHYNQTWQEEDLTKEAENGVIFAKDAVIRLQGTVEGQYSVATSKSIYIDDDIVYKTDPRDDASSKDLLGILAYKDVIVTDNEANRHDVRIDGSIYCQTGGFGAEKYDTRPVSGEIQLLGGVIQDTRAAVGTFSGGSTITHGFSKRYRYDERLMLSSPPFYPGTGEFEIVSWLE